MRDLEPRIEHLDYAAEDSRALINARWRRVGLTLIVMVAAPVLLVIALIAFGRPLSVASTRHFFWKGGDWDVLRVDGYEGHPGFSVTGAALAMKGRPNATVYVGINQSWSPEDGIWISSINGLDIELVQQRLLQDPRLTDEQRRVLVHHTGAMDVMVTGRFANLFPHPIRDFKDLRTHYDELYDILKTIADGQRATLQATKSQ